MTITLSDNNDYIFELENAVRGASANLRNLTDELRESNPELAAQLVDITNNLLGSVGKFHVASTTENTIVPLSVEGKANPKSVAITRWYRTTTKPTREAFILHWEITFGVEVYDYINRILDGFNVPGVTLSPTAIVAITHALNVQEGK